MINPTASLVLTSYSPERLMKILWVQSGLNGLMPVRLESFDERPWTSASYKTVLALPDARATSQMRGWAVAADASANEMMVERAMLLANTGEAPMTSAQINSAWNGDQLYSILQFMQDDYAQLTGRPDLAVDVLDSLRMTTYGYTPRRFVETPLKGFPLIKPYNPQQVATASFIRSERLAAVQKGAAGKIIAGLSSGQSTGDPALDQAVAVVKEQLQTSIAEDPTLPVIGSKNVDVDATASTQRVLELALLQAQQLKFIPEDQKKAAETGAVANLVQYWKENYPLVELRAVDNPQLSEAQLTADWSQYAQAPLVNIRVTPRTKPMPQLGFFAKYGAYIGIALALVPGVGLVGLAALAASTINQVQTLKSVQQYKNAFALTPSLFDPQYQPVPFYVVLPLDQAQAAVRQPWFVPMLSYKLRDESGGQYNPFK